MPVWLMNVFGEPLAELDKSATLCLNLLRGGMKCEYSFVSGGNTSCSIGELLESLSSHLWWPLLPEGLMREETMTIFVYRINRLRTIWAECVVFVEAIGEQAVAVMTSYYHRDR